MKRPLPSNAQGKRWRKRGDLLLSLFPTSSVTDRTVFNIMECATHTVWDSTMARRVESIRRWFRAWAHGISEKLGQFR